MHSRYDGRCATPRPTPRTSDKVGPQNCYGPYASDDPRLSATCERDARESSIDQVVVFTLSGQDVSCKGLTILYHFLLRTKERPGRLGRCSRESRHMGAINILVHSLC